jgi:hypothetical protein
MHACRQDRSGDGSRAALRHQAAPGQELPFRCGVVDPPKQPVERPSRIEAVGRRGNRCTHFNGAKCSVRSDFEHVRSQHRVVRLKKVRMTSNFDNFKLWYVQILGGLYEKRDAGIAVLMISLPLLERCLRRKHKLPPVDNITDAAMAGLCAMFPALGFRRLILGREVGCHR